MGKSKKIVRYCYMLAALLCCFLTLKQFPGQITRKIRFICYALCLLSLCKRETVAAGLGELFDRPWKKILLAVLEIYAVFSATGAYFLKTAYIYEVEYDRFLYFVMSFCWVCPIVQYAAVYLTRWSDRIVFSDHKARPATRWILMGIMMIPCIVFLIAFNPAITTVDSETCLNMAASLWKPDTSILNWHPPFYALVLKLLLRIYASIPFLIIVQQICFAAVFVDGILFLYQCGYSRKMLGVFYIFIAFGISNLTQLTTLWKDIPYMISLMWLTLLLMKFVMRHDRYQNSISWYIQFVAAVIFTCFFRHNGILPALAVIVILPVAAKFSKKAIVSCAACILLIMAINGPLYRSMNVESAPQMKFVSLANDIMNSYYEGKTVSDEAMGVINKVTNNDPDGFGYFTYIVNCNFDEPKGYSVPEFLMIYCENFLRNPKETIMAVAARNTVIWSIVKPYDEAAEWVNYLGECNQFALYPQRIPNRLTQILTDLCKRITDSKVLYLFIWRTGIYNLLIVMMIVGSLCSPKGRKLFYMMPYIPVAANVTALFISSGWSDYRYYWPSMTIGLLLLFFFLFAFRTDAAVSCKRAEAGGEGQ